MTYRRGELDAMVREAVAANVAASLRCPIATALQAEADLQAAFCFDERRKLLAMAAVVCHGAVLTGRDFRLDGLEDALDVAQVIKFSKE